MIVLLQFFSTLVSSSVQLEEETGFLLSLGELVALQVVA
jgi:hypothetical protein